MDKQRLSPSKLFDRRFVRQDCAAALTPGPQETAVSDFPVKPAGRRSVNGKDFIQDRKYFCERCWRGYHEKRLYDEHVLQHVKCSFEGCSFEALPFRVAKHTIAMHSGGGLPGSFNMELKHIRNKKRMKCVDGSVHPDVARETPAGNSIKEVPSSSCEAEAKSVSKPGTSAQDHTEPGDPEFDVVYKELEEMDKWFQNVPSCPRQNLRIRHSECPFEQGTSYGKCCEQALILQCIRYVVDNMLTSKNCS